MRSSLLVRMGVIGVIVLCLLVPLSMTLALVSERAGRRDAAVSEIGSMWAGPQVVGSPILIVPYQCPASTATKEHAACVGSVFVLPEELQATATLEPEVRRRNLFEAVVYRSHVALSMKFAQTGLGGGLPSGAQPVWDQARIGIGVTDPKGVKGQATLRSESGSVDFAAGVPMTGIYSTGMHAPAGVTSETDLIGRTFTTDLELRGTRDVTFLVGRNATVHVTSTWPHPSFIGGLLPDARETRPDGFAATWTIGALATPLPVSWTTESLPSGSAAQNAGFGVSLVEPVDIYVQTERAVKYGVLFVVLTFAISFVWEVTRQISVHPVQYILIGFALSIFYLLLLSLSEHAGFDTAYLAASAATVGLLGWYWRWVAGSAAQGAAMAIFMAALYGFLYLLLRLEDYALLAGSVGVFVILAGLMFITRRVNWFASSGSTQVSG